jgi:signal transduction histidine kinase/ActR/RegA family two-component response regulator
MNLESPDDDPVKLKQHFSDLEAHRPFDNFLIQRRGQDGSLQRFKISGNPRFGPDDEFIGYLGTGQDITAETAAQDEAERSKALLVNAIENFSDMIAVYDPDERLVMLNSAFRKDVGPEVTIGDSFETVQRKRLKGGRIPYEAHGQEEEWLAQRLEEFRNPKGPLEVGSPGFRVQIRFERLPDGGTIAFISNITEQKQREEALSQAQKMEAVGQLTGGIAHDFNNLLTVVIGNLELADDVAGGDKDISQFTTRANQAAERGAVLTHRLLAFSRKQDLIPSTFDANDLVMGMSDLMRSSLGETIEINFVGGEDLWLCKADAGQLENTILNLGINARDAMPNGGKLTISTENVDMNDDYAAAAADVEPGEYVLIAVSDTGTGMSREVLEHAFEPFYTTKEVGQGSGLGLSMVYGFAKQSGGHATIYSEEGIGTTIKLYLPKSSDSAEDKPSGLEISAPRSQGETILVVEDDPEVRTLTVALLRGLGYEIIEASDAASALRALETSPRVNLLFSDVVLPGGSSGIDLAKQICEIRPGISVLFTSGYTEEAMAGHGAHDDDFELLGKPFKRDTLARKIRSVLDQGTIG